MLPALLVAFLPFWQAASASATAQEQPLGPEVEIVYYDGVLPNGRLVGGRMPVLVDRALHTVPPTHGAAVGWSAGDPANRLDVVFVGDGYTTADLGAYALHVSAQQAAMFQREPFATYVDYFNVHRIDVVSNESGVDNDPVQGIQKDTALDMGFWCGGTERALCVNVGKALSFASLAPDVDLVAAVANSTKYGGVGYPWSKLGTVAGGNLHANEVLLHEFGHALANLADEYDYGATGTYGGPEPAQPNLSTLNSAAMGAAGTKWADWLGHFDPAFDGLVSTFEGAGYHKLGLFRPTNDSLMRNLGRPFNPPSVEALVIEIYRHVSPIDDASSEAVLYDGVETLFVDPLDPVGHDLTIQWSLDGAPLAGATGTTLDLAALGLSPGFHDVSVTASDETSWVRDAAAIANLLTDRRDYAAFVTCEATAQTFCAAKTNSCGGVPAISASGTASPRASAGFVVRGSGARAGKPGVLFYNDAGSAQLPFQGGFLCVEPMGLRRALPVIATGGAPGAPCSSRFEFDLNAFAAGALGGSPSSYLSNPGARITCQWWGRDSVTQGSYLSDGLEYTVCP